MKRRVVAACAAATFVIAGSAAWLWAPRWLRGQAERTLAARTRLDVRVGEVDLGMGSVTLSDLVLTFRDQAASVTIKRTRVDGGVLRLAVDGVEGVDSVDVEGLDVRLSLHKVGEQPSGSTRKEAQRPARSTTSASGFPNLRVTNLAVHVDDSDGPLLRAQEGSVSFNQSNASVRFATVRVGDEATDHAVFKDVSIHIARRSKGFVLDRIAVEGGELVWLQHADPDRSTLARIRNAPASLARLASSLRATRKVSLAASSASDPFSLFKPGATVEFADLRVSTRDAKSRSALLRRLHGKLVNRGNGRLGFEGGSETTGEGTLRWNLVLEPTRLRAEGTLEFSSLPLAFITPLVRRIPWYEPEDARLDGRLVLESHSPDRLDFDGRVALSNAGLYSNRLAPVPVTGIALGFDGSGHWFPAQHRLEVERGVVTLGPARAQLSGGLQWNGPRYAVHLRAELPWTPCEVALSSIPNDLWGDLEGFSWEGSLGGQLEARVDSESLEETQLSIQVRDRCVFVTVPAHADTRRYDRPFLHRVEEPDGTVFELATGPGTPEWTALDRISPYLVQAVLAHEDASFFRHAGFAPWAIRDALARNLEAGRYVVGASTITMQLAKNLFLTRDKTLARKLHEVILTWWLETAMDKRRLLELYLNIIEYGPGVYGIREAARHYFARRPADLSPAEAAFLASILPNPKAYHAQYARNALSKGTLRRIERLLRQMHQKGRIGGEALTYGLGELAGFSFAQPGALAPVPRALPKDVAPVGDIRSEDVGIPLEIGH